MGGGGLCADGVLGPETQVVCTLLPEPHGYTGIASIASVHTDFATKAKRACVALHVHTKVPNTRLI